MKKIIYPIEELRKICGYYDWDGEAYERYHFIDVCLHPESKSPYYDEGHCMASNCPLGGLAEYQDFRSAGIQMKRQGTETTKWIVCLYTRRIRNDRLSFASCHHHNSIHICNDLVKRQEMNKTKQKAFDKLIKEAAHKSVLHLSDVSFDLTQRVFLELCKAVRSELDTTIQRMENYQRPTS